MTRVRQEYYAGSAQSNHSSPRVPISQNCYVKAHILIQHSHPSAYSSHQRNSFGVCCFTRALRHIELHVTRVSENSSSLINYTREKVPLRWRELEVTVLIRRSISHCSSPGSSPRVRGLSSVIILHSVSGENQHFHEGIKGK